MQKENTSELYIHEWAAVAIVVGFIAMLTASVYLSAPPQTLQIGTAHHLLDPSVEVFVQGSVANPGPRRVPRGTIVEDVLKEAQLLPEANIRRLNLQARVRHNQVIRIPAKRPSRRRTAVQPKTTVQKSEAGGRDSEAGSQKQPEVRIQNSEARSRNIVVEL